MALIINSFPKHSQMMKKQTGYSPASYSFFYDNSRNREELKAERLTNGAGSDASIGIRLSDPGGSWHPKKDNLVLVGTCSVKVPHFLFGPKGIAPKTGTIGVAVEWSAKDSGIRGTHPVGELTYNDTSPKSFRIQKIFPAQTLRGTLSLKTIYYLKKAGIPNINESHLAKIPGTVLGELDETKVFIDGNGSVFPVSMVDEPGKPLWWVDCNWTDSIEDAFTEENFCLNINTANKAYKAYIDDKEFIQSPLFSEIIAGALQILIENTLCDQTASAQVISGKGLRPDSVGAVVHYMIHAFDWNANLDRPDMLARQIRQTLGERMG